MLLKIFCVLSISISAYAKAIKENEAEFWKLSGLKQGDYNLTAGPVECDDGELVTQIGETDFTLVLGPRPLILGLGRVGSTKPQGSCNSVYKGTVSSKKVTGLITENCKDVKSIRKVEVVPTKTGFKYTRLTTVNGENKPLLECELVFAGNEKN